MKSGKTRILFPGAMHFLSGYLFKAQVLSVFFAASINITIYGQEMQAQNPVIYADVPDMSMVRIGSTYYMSSTTMHMCPGVPVMKSNDLVNWQIVNYAYDIIGNTDELTLNNGKNAYGKGTWASSIRYQNARRIRRFRLVPHK